MGDATGYPYVCCCDQVLCLVKGGVRVSVNLAVVKY